MRARVLSWWQYISEYWVVVVTIFALAIIIVALIIIGYRFDLTGFNGYNQVTTAHTISGPSAGTFVRTEVSQPGKTLWDWLQLLIIPGVLLIIGLLFNSEQKRREEKTTTDNQREATLKEYIDKISELLLKEHLGELTADGKLKPEYEQVWKIARVRTLTVLPRLDTIRKASVLQFLYEADLINEGNYIVDLAGADLRGAKLSFADLEDASPRKANLSEAFLIGANLKNTDLTETNLFKANLYEADLREARLVGANLNGADLSGANLKDATGITVEKLEQQAKSLKGATMPDGSTHP